MYYYISKFIMVKEQIEKFIFIYSSIVLDSSLINTTLFIGKIIETVLMKLFFILVFFFSQCTMFAKMFIFSKVCLILLSSIKKLFVCADNDQKLGSN